MSFPNLVSADRSACEAPGKFGPYLAGSNRYVFLSLFTPDPVARTLEAWKSTDGGATWSLVSTLAATLFTSGTPAYTTCQSKTDATKVLAFYLDNNTAQITPATFDTSTDTWAIHTAAGFPPAASFSFGAFLVATHRPASNTCIVAQVGDDYTDADGEVHHIPVYASYDVAGDSWSSWTDAGYTDYATVIGWHLVPGGIVLRSDGKLTLFTQQIAHAVPVGRLSGLAGADAPWYADTVDIEAWGGGGGGGAGHNASSAGGGGGAGQYSAGSASVGGGTFPTATVGSGGVGGQYGGSGGPEDGAAGGDTICGSVTASGGDPGLADGTPGGNGGQGFLTTGVPGGGGGGGGGDNANGSGGIGQDGVEYDGTAGDPNGGDGGAAPPAGNGSGGGGGTYDPVNVTGGGGGGGQPGGGGGGGAIVSIPPGPGTHPNGDGGAGGDGEVSLSYFAVQGTIYNSRLWQQVINADNSLGTDSEITAAQFPMQAFEMAPVLLAFDCVAVGGEVAIAFSGAYASSGYADVAAGRGTNADPIVFSLVDQVAGDGGADPAPALSVTGGTVYLSYMSSPSHIFRYRTDAGSGFGGATDFGAFDDPGMRINSGAFPGDEIAFTTPTPCLTQLFAPE